jgi:L-ascorbate metabolism protein UlaG (beta-lactamase superfamily)
VPIPLRSALSALRDPSARHANDRSALLASHVRNAPPGASALPPGLSLTWLGTAGFRFVYEGYTLLIDPYLSRPSLLATLARAPLAVDHARLEALVPEADAILVGHTHFDHALDVPAIARRLQCKAYGSRSLSTLMAAHGLGALAVEVACARPFELGPFTVTFIESVHSKMVGGVWVAAGGELTCDHVDELRGSAYRCGQVFGIHISVANTSFYHQGSADLIDDRVTHRNVDVLLAGIAGRGFTRDYARRILSRLEPRVVLAQHFDDFFRPIDAPMGFSLNVNFGGFLDEVRAVSSDFTVCALEPLQPWRG